ncbi:MAG: RdgB/HAM1 family non-canonical purine NTP pyrophosphatase [Acidimicrobiales bacterium]
MIELVLATANPDKALEITSILAEKGISVLPRPLEVADVEETGATLVENARLKAVALRTATGLAAVSDDTGLEVDYLAGAPGVYSARYAGPGASYGENVEKLLRALEGVPRPGRGARFISIAMASFPDGSELWSEGSVLGHISEEAHGGGGFGYDPLFIPDGGDGRTFAQMSPHEKRALSHRGLAFRSLAAQLGALGF